MKRILYILLDENVNEITSFDADNIKITLIKGNKSYLMHNRFCGARYHIIYLDAALNTIIYRDWIDTCIKPMCTARGAEGIIFI